MFSSAVSLVPTFLVVLNFTWPTVEGHYNATQRARNYVYTNSWNANCHTRQRLTRYPLCLYFFFSVGPRGPCPTGFYSGCSDRCYKLVQATASWDEARTVCRASNGDLAAIRSHEEQTCITRYTGSEGMIVPYFWTGLYRSSRQAAWISAHNGQNSTFFNWEAG